MQANAAQSAADTTANATQYASNLQNQQFQQMQANLQPYMGAGQTGLGALMGMLGLGGTGNQTAGQIYQSLLPQYTSTVQNAAPSAASLGAAGGVWGYDPTTNQYGYQVTSGSGGDAGNQSTSWVYAPGYTPTSQTINQAGLSNAVGQALGAQAGARQLGPLGQILQTPFSFNASNLNQTPGYQFTMQQGLKALNNQAAAQGLNMSGAQQKGLLSYATGLADQTYNQQYQNALQSYQTNYGIANDMYNRLSGLAGMGENAAAGVGNAGLQTASNIGNLAVQGAQAQGSGAIGAANAIGGAAAGLGGLGMNYGLMQQLGLGGSGGTLGGTDVGNMMPYLQNLASNSYA